MEPLTAIALAVAGCILVFCLVPTAVAFVAAVRRLWRSTWKPMFLAACVDLWKRGHLTDAEAMRLWGEVRLLGLHIVALGFLMILLALLDWAREVRLVLASSGAVLLFVRVLLHLALMSRLRDGGFVRRK